MYRKFCVVMGMTLLSSCSQEKVDVLLDCASPSGQKVATVFVVQTGSRPIDRLVRVNIHGVSEQADTASASFVFRHGYDAILHWQSDHELTIDYPEGAEIKQQEPAVFGSSQQFDPNDVLRLRYVERASTHGYFRVEQRCFAQGGG